jgi:hypothetical protein
MSIFAATLVKTEEKSFSTRFPVAFDGGRFSNSKFKSLSSASPDRVETMTGPAFPLVGQPVTVRLDIDIDNLKFSADGL